MVSRNKNIRSTKSLHIISNLYVGKDIRIIIDIKNMKKGS